MENKIQELVQAAKTKRLKGCLGYEVGVSGSDSILEVFLSVFSDTLEMEYPTDDIYGAYIQPGKKAVKILFVKGINDEIEARSRENIIYFIHNTLNEDVWHGAWLTVIGRS